MTPNDIILQALKTAGVLGVGQPASAEDVSDALFHLNIMLGEWSQKRWLVYHLVDAVKQANGSLYYTVGIGGDFNVTRPDKIDSAFFRQTNVNPGTPPDYPLSVIQAKEEYNRIRLKTLNSWPQAVFYDSDYPLGKLYVWPVPNSNYEIHISFKVVLTEVTAAQTLVLPPEYRSAILYNLGCRLRPNYQLPPDPSLVALAKNSLNVLRQANVQIPTATLPVGLTRGGGSNYNVYSDTGG